MPTNYNFTTDVNHWDLALPNTAKGGPKLKRYLEIISLNNGGTTGWEVPSTGISTGTMSIDYTQTSPLGNYPLKFTSTGTANVQSEYFNSPKLIQIYTPNSTDTYYAKLWFKSDLANGTVFNTLSFNSGGSGGGVGITTANTWYNVYGDRVGVAGEIQNAYIVIGINSPLIGQNYWFDLEYIKRQSRTGFAPNYVYTDLDTKSIQSFDNQFIPADTFRQGNLWTWGNAGNGQLGTGSITGRSTPSLVNANSYWRNVSTGGAHTAAITTTGQLWSTGFNNSGQIGVNSVSTQINVFTREFTSSTNWTLLSCGGNSTAAIKSDGTLWLWGNNVNLELGLNDNTLRRTPVQEFTSSTNWKYVSGGSSNFAAIKTDGTLWIWGSNLDSQLGQNSSITNPSTPVQEWTSSTNWKQVSFGRFFVAAIKTNGTLWSWGYNSFGNLGINNQITTSTPVQEFTSSTNWKQVSCGAFHTAAIKTDGSLWIWGLNSSRQLGSNDGSSRFTPSMEATSSTNWKQVNCLDSGTAAIKTDGTFWHTGSNTFSSPGGTNDLIYRSSLTQEFTGSTQWGKIANGSANAFIGAIKYIDPVI